MTTDDQTPPSEPSGDGEQPNGDGEQPNGGTNPWVWVAVAAGVVALIVLAINIFGDDDEVADTTTTTQLTTTTTTATTSTTTEATTTTTVEETTTTTTETSTTTTLTASAVPTTPIFGVMAPYPPEEEGLALSPTPVEAHWYQYQDRYVVLYRGFDASAETPLCPGTSIRDEAGTTTFASNSPIMGTVDEVCSTAERIAQPPFGVYACGTLLYYVTEIPTESEGTLIGNLEVSTGDGFIGQTSEIAADLETPPEFTPGLTEYELPATEVDTGGSVTCTESS